MTFLLHSLYRLQQNLRTYWQLSYYNASGIMYSVNNGTRATAISPFLVYPRGSPNPLDAMMSLSISEAPASRVFPTQRR